MAEPWPDRKSYASPMGHVWVLSPIGCEASLRHVSLRMVSMEVSIYGGLGRSGGNDSAGSGDATPRHQRRNRVNDSASFIPLP